MSESNPDDLSLASMFSIESGARDLHGGDLCPTCLGATRVCRLCLEPRSLCQCSEVLLDGTLDDNMTPVVSGWVNKFDPVVCLVCGGSGAQT